jgi:hypothetical protein
MVGGSDHAARLNGGWTRGHRPRERTPHLTSLHDPAAWVRSGACRHRASTTSVAQKHPPSPSISSLSRRGNEFAPAWNHKAPGDATEAADQSQRTPCAGITNGGNRGGCYSSFSLSLQWRLGEGTTGSDRLRGWGRGRESRRSSVLSSEGEAGLNRGPWFPAAGARASESHGGRKTQLHGGPTRWL